MTLAEHLARVRPEDAEQALAVMRHEARRRARSAAASAAVPRFCPRCGETKRSDAFANCATRPDGLDWSCKACVSAAERARRERRRSA